MNSKETWKNILIVLVVVVYPSVTEGWKDRVKLHDVNVLTLRQGHMTNGRRSAPVPQMACVGGSAGCSAFVPKVVQCYNRGSDGYDIQWECKTDMDNAYRFGEIAVNCEGYDYPEDPYILKGSCGLEYTIDHVGSNSGNAYHHESSYHHSNQHGNYGYKHRKRGFPCSMSTLIMWGVIAFIAYYIYSTCSSGQHTTDSTQNAYQQSTYSAPPPPGFRPEYMQDQRDHTTNTGSSSSSSSSASGSSNGLGGFWSGFGAGGLAGYLFGSSRGHGRSGYNYHHDPYSTSGYNRGYGNGWFSGGSGSSWFGGNSGNTGWFGSSGSTFGSTHRRSSPSSSSSSGSRTASGFGGTKRR